MAEYTNEKHKKVKKILRIVGIILFLVGVGLSIFGGIFFAKNFEDPMNMTTNFAAFDMIFLGLGSFLSISGLFLFFISFIVSVGKYVSKESAEIQKQLIYDVKDDHKEYAKTISSGIKEGLKDGNSSFTCPYCHHAVKTSDKYCDSCGSRLVKTCPSCLKENDPDAKYCSGCGRSLF